MRDPGFYPLLQHGDGAVHLIHCEVEKGRIHAEVMVVAPAFAEEWAQLTSEADYQGDRCEVYLPSSCVNAPDRLKVYDVSLPFRILS